MEGDVYLSKLFKDEIWLDYSSAKNKKTNKEKNDRTLKDYLRNVHYICSYYKKDFLDIQPDEARTYFSMLSEKKKYTVRSINAILVSLRNLSGFIEEHRDKYKLINYSNVFLTVTTPKYDTYYKEDDLPTEEEIDMLLVACQDNIMLSLILMFITRMGLTATEVCKLNQGQIKIDGADRYYIDFKKGSQNRYVKIPTDLMESFLMYYVPNTTSNISERDKTPIFLNKRKKAIQVRSLEMYLKSLVKVAGIQKHITLQGLRNAATARMLFNGAPSDKVAKYTGISNRWIYRYNRVIPELDNAPCDYN